MNLLKKHEKINDLVKDVNQILSANGVQEQITLCDITITENTVSDLVKEKAKLSDAITNFLWPSIVSATVYHFTSKGAAEKILNSGIFRLNNIANRYGEGEILTFCKTHKLNGYLEKDKNSDPKYRNLIMPNTFYASFTDVSLTKDNEEYFWNTFAPYEGVRLKFEITASKPIFRKIYYERVEGEPIRLLSELTECIREKYNYEFILKGISQLCSFYLSGKDYGREDEYRILYTIPQGLDPQLEKDRAHSYIELPLNVPNEYDCQLEVIEVHSYEKPNMPSAYSCKFSKRGT